MSFSTNKHTYNINKTWAFLHTTGGKDDWYVLCVNLYLYTCLKCSYGRLGHVCKQMSLILWPNSVFIKMKISYLVCTVRFWNNLHQVHSE
jgi:hypothetical protein